MPRRVPDAESLRPGWFSIVQQVLQPVQQYSKFSRFVLLDGLSSPKWTMSPPRTPTASPTLQRGFLPNGRTPKTPRYDINYGAASSVAIAAKPSLVLPTRPMRHAGAGSRHSWEFLHRTRSRAAERLRLKNSGTRRPTAKCSGKPTLSATIRHSMPQAPPAPTGRHSPAEPQREPRETQNGRCQDTLMLPLRIRHSDVRA